MRKPETVTIIFGYCYSLFLVIGSRSIWTDEGIAADINLWVGIILAIFTTLLLQKVADI